MHLVQQYLPIIAHDIWSATRDCLIFLSVVGWLITGGLGLRGAIKTRRKSPTT
jgi:hypothetical protein